jgi:hypothetical protein
MQNLISKEEKDRIDLICQEYNIENYTINSSGSIDVDGNVDLFNRELIQLPLVFNKVSGYFYCSVNKLTSLSGSPRIVGGNFECGANSFYNLIGGPVSVGGNFICAGEEFEPYGLLTSLEGSPKKIGGYFDCSNNKLTTLVGSPVEVGDEFSCSNNKLTTLVGSPRTVLANFVCDDNELTTLIGCPETVIGSFWITHNALVSTYSGDIDIDLHAECFFGDIKFPQMFTENLAHIKLILKYQRHFFIWNDDLSLNEENFQVLLDEINDGLL